GSLVIDPDQYVSILDGQNARRVVTSESIIGIPRLSGFTIKNGNADGLAAGCTAYEPAGCGGGIFISNAALTIENCIIEHNVAATTYASGAYYGYGGGVYIQNPAGVTITKSIIRQNTASAATDITGYDIGYGGGIHVSGSADPEDLIITNNEISENEVAEVSHLGWGAGFYIVYSSGLISGNFIHDNNTNMGANGSAFYSGHSDIIIQNNQIVDNPGLNVLNLESFYGYVSSNVIINPGSDHGIFLNMNYPGDISILDNNIISQHEIANIKAHGSDGGFGVTAQLYHNTLDSASYGIYQDGYAYSLASNNIISNHTIQGVYKSPTSTGNTINLAHSLYYGNNDDGDSDMDMNNSPVYGDPAYWDATNGNYHIRAHSAARDKSLGEGYAYDIDGSSRPIGSSSTPYDIGADEFMGWFLPLIQRP
ncbi:MAG: right-handed parallel beta-helix repeat-containing protein, partial [Anaerolineaceae bacterium]|nr:right-handed parallel beta-helix repeat-containing protein [Anaerolineaceae bacterium]